MMTITALAMLTLAGTSHADSPVTSIKFHRAYADVPMVAKALEKGVLDKKMADFLSSPQNPIGQKAAVINALGWSVSGNGEPRDARAKQNAILYASFGSQGPRKNLNTDEIFSLGYLLLMDLYSDPQNALPWLEKAYQERPSSLTIRMIYALGQAQYHVQTGDYCKAWQTVDSSTRGNNLRKDLHPAAVKIIVDHMRGYKPYCSEPLKSLKSKGPGILI